MYGHRLVCTHRCCTFIYSYVRVVRRTGDRKCWTKAGSTAREDDRDKAKVYDDITNISKFDYTRGRRHFITSAWRTSLDQEGSVHEWECRNFVPVGLQCHSCSFICRLMDKLGRHSSLARGTKLNKSEPYLARPLSIFVFQVFT